MAEKDNCIDDTLHTDIGNELSEETEENQDSQQNVTTAEIWKDFNISDLHHHDERDLYMYLLNRCDNIIQEQESRIEKARTKSYQLAVLIIMLETIYLVAVVAMFVNETIVDNMLIAISTLFVVSMSILYLIPFFHFTRKGEKEEELANYHPSNEPENQTARAILMIANDVHRSGEYILKSRSLTMEENYQYLKNKTAIVRLMYIFILFFLLLVPLSFSIPVLVQQAII